MSPSVKLAVGAGIIILATAYMSYVGARASWKYYVTVDECLARAPELAGRRIRVSGMVAEGSLRIESERAGASFDLQGVTDSLKIVYRGSLPDNLAEHIEVVVEGQLEADGQLYGDKLLTRCASKYENDPESSRDGAAIVRSTPESRGAP